MKLCYLGDASSVHTQRWLKYFAEKGHDVHLISYVVSNIDGVEVHKLPKVKNDYLSFIIRYLKVRKLIKDIKPDIIHAHYIGGYGWLGALLGFHPFVASVWGSDILIEPNISRISSILTKYALKKADIITCDGENTKNSMTSLKIEHKKINIIYHGVDTTEFISTKKDEKFIEDLVGGKHPVIISARGLVQKNDMVTLVNAIPMVLKKISDARFIIAGEGGEKVYLKEIADSLGVLDSIRFIEWIPHDELSKYLASSEVYVSTSLWDGGISISTLDAMACEIPCVVTDIADNKMWIKDGINGFVVPIKNPKILADKIIYLLENGNIRENYGKISRKIVEENHNYFEEMDKVEHLYNKLLGV